MFLKAVYLLGVTFSAELTGKVVSGAKNKIAYGPTGNDARLEFIDQPKLSQTQLDGLLGKVERNEVTVRELRDMLSKKIEISIFKIRKAKFQNKKDSVNQYRYVALPTQFDKWVKDLYDYFKKAGGKYLFPHSRSHYWNLIGKNETFRGLIYKVPDYTRTKLGISGKTSGTETEHSKDLLLAGLRHVRYEELQTEYDFDEIDWAVFTEKKFKVGQNSYVLFGDWHHYIEKLCKKPSFQRNQQKVTLSDF
jgi:hypothetical protein